MDASTSASSPDTEPTPRALFVAFGILAAGIVAAGYVGYRRVEAQYRTQVERELSAVANLKVRELLNWRAERMADGDVRRRNPVFAALVTRWFRNPRDAQAERLLRAWLTLAQEGEQYDRLVLLDDRGAERLAAPDTREAPSPVVVAAAEAALRSGKETFLGFYRDAPGGSPSLAVIAPITGALEGGRPVGVLVLRIDPALHLYPAVERWPVPSRTSETLIIGRDGRDVVFLNPLRFRPDAALNLRIPLTKLDVPAVSAVLGHEGLLEGTDYHGARVVAALRGIPGSPWFIIAKTDLSEAYAPLRQRLWSLALLVAFLVTGAGAAVAWTWRQRSARYFKEQAKAADAIRALNADLERRVAERTAELAEANRGLEAFAYSVSHDLRAPLRSIDGFGKILLEDFAGPLGDEGRQHLHRMRAASQRMGHLIDDMLKLSRVSRVELRREPVDLTALATSVVAELREADPGRAVSVSIQSGLSAKGDPALLRIALENLLGNAWKFTTARPDASISFGAEQHNGVRAWVVRDNGAGFDMAYADKLFAPFQRLHRQDEFPGSGIGLATVARIVGRHGGRAWAESAVDKGTAVSFTLE